MADLECSCHSRSSQDWPGLLSLYMPCLSTSKLVVPWTVFKPTSIFHCQVITPFQFSSSLFTFIYNSHFASSTTHIPMATPNSPLPCPSPSMFPIYAFAVTYLFFTLPSLSPSLSIWTTIFITATQANLSVSIHIQNFTPRYTVFSVLYVSNYWCQPLHGLPYPNNHPNCQSQY